MLDGQQATAGVEEASMVADTSEAGCAEVASAEPVISQADPCILGGELRASQAELAGYQ
jgi:hypothetical protein